jgi:hypothetical protein
MNIPRFTAEASLTRTVCDYTNSSSPAGRRATSSVIPQLLCPPECSFSCTPPGCERTGHCTHCSCQCPPGRG